MEVQKKFRRSFILMFSSVFLLFILFLLNILWGSVSISFAEVIGVMSGSYDGVSAANIIIIEQFRFPQAITATFAGAGLAVAGLLMQTLFRNPLADPSILGISAGASLGVALLLLSTGMVSGQALISFGWLSHIGIILASFAGAMLVLALITILSKRLMNMVSLLIAGIMIAYVAGAIVGIIKYFSHKEDLHAFVIWGLGSFSNVGLSQIPFFVIAVSLGLVASVLLMKPLNLMLLGEKYARNLGLNVKHYQTILLLVAGFLTAVITAYAGPIAFIGLAVPHLARNLFRSSDHKILIPSTIIIGAALALFCNLIARLPGFEGSLPVNSITSLIGAPVVVWIILKRQQLYSRSA
ncbi:MAG: iron ABC transporter permease [Bacteroidetes bacterium]|nr:iron ABC transporter permease [Bacteroidota bacterium]